MFDRFADSAIKLVTDAQLEARRLGHVQVDREHIILAMLRDSRSTIRKCLGASGIDHDAAFEVIEKSIRVSATSPVGPFTPQVDALFRKALGEIEAVTDKLVHADLLLLTLLAANEDDPLSPLLTLGLSRQVLEEQTKTELSKILSKRERTPDRTVMESLNDRNKVVIEIARSEAIRLGHREVQPEHLLLGIVQEGTSGAAKILKSAGLKVRHLRAEVEKHLGPVDSSGTDQTPLSDRSIEVLDRAQNRAGFFGISDVSPELLLLALLDLPGSCTKEILSNLAVSDGDVLGELMYRCFMPGRIEHDLYDRIFGLLGKSDNDIEWLRLLADVGKSTRQYDIGSPGKKEHRFIDFDRYGFSITYDRNRNAFFSASFHFATRSVRDGGVSPFPGAVQAGIRAADTRLEVQQKMRISPYFASDPHNLTPLPPYDDGRSHWVKYALGKYRFIFVFTSFEESLSLLGVDLRGTIHVEGEA